MQRQLELLHLLRLASQALPVGGYAYSQGLEAAIESKCLQTEQDILGWLHDVLIYGPGKLELPILARQRDNWSIGDLAAVKSWNQIQAAYRETSEFLFEDQQMGRALCRLLAEEGIVQAQSWTGELPCFSTMFALAGADKAIAAEPLLQAFAWAWLENQTTVASKVLPLGQTSAQRILVALMPVIEQVCNTALNMIDDQIGFSLPGLAILSCHHEQQHTRLFRS